MPAWGNAPGIGRKVGDEAEGPIHRAWHGLSVLGCESGGRKPRASPWLIYVGPLALQRQLKRHPEGGVMDHFGGSCDSVATLGSKTTTFGPFMYCW